MAALYVSSGQHYFLVKFEMTTLHRPLKVLLL